jgi:hypothetical protein
MTELVHKDVADVPVDTSSDASSDDNALITSLRSAGAARFDPVRWHYIEVLAKRAAAHQDSIKCMLDAKVTQALAAFNERFEQARSDASELVTRSAQQYPQAANELQRLFAAADFKALRQLIARLNTREQCASLGALVRRLEQHAPDLAHAGVEKNIGLRPELKVIQNHRNTWAKLSADKRFAQALDHAPKNAGPMNSHSLVLRSLALMRDISPDYLNRFMSYADTLLCLDQCGQEKADISKSPKSSNDQPDKTKSRKPRRNKKDDKGR